MSDRHVIDLPGCTPEPLMSYLKALGVLRLVSEQADPEVRGWWRNEHFVIESRLEQRSIVDFFLFEYAPSPIIAPWGARSGFFSASSEKTARKALEAIEKQKDERFTRFQEVIQEVRQLLQSLGFRDKPEGENKLRLMRACRARLSDNTLSWLDTCYVLTGESRRFPPVLGTGGNEGSGSYVSGFAQQLEECLIKRKHDLDLETSLFAKPHHGVGSSQTPGHFSPTAAGGANSSQGLWGPVFTNPWDYLLCIEGTCVWASSVVRQLVSGGTGIASYPFTTDVSGAGGSLDQADAKKPSQAKREIAEMWLPLWSQPACYSEIQLLFSEGRASVGRRLARTGTDMARAIAELGVDRGIQSFERVTFLMRNGQNFMAIHQGRFDVRAADDASLLRRLDRTLDALRALDRPPARLTYAFRGLEAKIFDYCKYGNSEDLLEVLVAAGQVEQALAVTGGQLRGRQICPPIQGLSPRWIDATNDHTPEFQLAVGLAGIYHSESWEKRLPPIRANLEPVKPEWRGWVWEEVDKSVVWKSAHLSENLSAVLHRRLQDATRKESGNSPIESRQGVGLEAVALFLAGEPYVNDRRVDDLLWALCLVEPKRLKGTFAVIRKSPPLPRSYTLLKPLFLPRPPVRDLEGRWSYAEDTAQQTWFEPSILPLLRAGRVSEACRVALRRLRVNRADPLLGAALDRIGDDVEIGVDPTRLAAALLLPLHPDDLNRLMSLITRPSEVQPSESQGVEII